MDSEFVIARNINALIANEWTCALDDFIYKKASNTDQMYTLNHNADIRKFPIYVYLNTNRARDDARYHQTVRILVPRYHI